MNTVKDEISVSTPYIYFHTTPREDFEPRHTLALHGGTSVALGLELMTPWPRVQDHVPLATTPVKENSKKYTYYYKVHAIDRPSSLMWLK
ncbi:hypothetical protein TNCV_4156971 [Trichonephila clavipes]|nr:hypothetical protein TNCV_4156971 [Trichonephila clavipes]